MRIQNAIHDIMRIVCNCNVFCMLILVIKHDKFIDIWCQQQQCIHFNYYKYKSVHSPFLCCKQVVWPWPGSVLPIHVPYWPTGIFCVSLHVQASQHIVQVCGSPTNLDSSIILYLFYTWPHNYVVVNNMQLQRFLCA